jgi:hypothetical protein
LAGTRLGNGIFPYFPLLLCQPFIDLNFYVLAPVCIQRFNLRPVPFFHFFNLRVEFVNLLLEPFALTLEARQHVWWGLLPVG